MTPNVVGRWIGRASLAGGLAIAFAGCPDSPEEITESASPSAFNFPVATVFEEPTGSFAVNRLTLAAFDTTVTNAFDREVTGLDGLGMFAADPFFDFPGWNLWSTGRNSTQDPRLPALSGTGTEAVDRFCGLWGPGFGGGTGVWDLFCEMQGMTALGRYTIMLARYATRINGALDASEVLLTGSVTNPDELVLLGGTPDGFPTTPCDFSTFVNPIANANPLVLGFADADASGAIQFIDCLIDSGGIWWASTEGPPPAGAADSAAFAPNVQQTFGLPEYNYVVLVLGQGTLVDPVPVGPHAFRWQVGPDILEDGTPINNGLAPFPDGPATVPELVNAPGGAGRPDSVSVTFNRLEALAGGALYEAWLVNPLTGSMVPAVGTYNRIKIIAERDPITGDIIATRDSVVETISATASFLGGDQEDGFRHELIFSDATVAPETLGVHSHLMLTVDGTPGDMTPSDARPFWITITNQNGTATNFFDDVINSSGGTNFGTFNVTNAAASRTYSAQGIGLGGVRDDILSVDLENLSRPPVGYQYVAWLVPDSGAAVQLPEITGPPPQRVSLADADTDLVPGLVTTTGILQANFRAVESDLGAGFDFSGFPTFMVTLEPKAGDPALGSLPAIVGPIPPQVLAGARVSN